MWGTGDKIKGTGRNYGVKIPQKVKMRIVLHQEAGVEASGKYRDARAASPGSEDIRVVTGVSGPQGSFSSPCKVLLETEKAGG